jgi:ABC-type phosphate transport system auxiliary subunit
MTAFIQAGTAWVWSSAQCCSGLAISLQYVFGGMFILAVISLILMLFYPVKVSGEV